MHWTQTADGKARIAKIAAMGRAAQGLAPSDGRKTVAVKERVGRPGTRTPAEKKRQSLAMKESWARRRRAHNGNKHVSNGHANRHTESDSGIVTQIHSLAHAMSDAALNGGLSPVEASGLRNLSKLIDLHV